MPRTRKPRRGSLQFWPRVRAKRLYPRIRSFKPVNNIKPLEFACYKAGMTHVQYLDTDKNSPTKNQIISKAVTVLEAPSLLVLALRFYKKSPYGLSVVGEFWHDVPDFVKRKYPKGKMEKNYEGDFDDVRLIVSTQPHKINLKKTPEIFEIHLGGDDKEKKLEYAKSLLGKEISVKDVFSEGEYVDVTAITKGKGFQGPVKRFGIKIQGRKDKQHHRHVGSVGQERPGKIRWTVPRPGQMGLHQRTEYKKRIIKIGDDGLEFKGGLIGYGNIKKDYILIEGSVPGSKKRLVFLRVSMRPVAPKPVSISYISKESKQGV